MCIYMPILSQRLSCTGESEWIWEKGDNDYLYYYYVYTYTYIYIYIYIYIYMPVAPLTARLGAPTRSSLRRWPCPITYTKLYLLLILYMYY